MYGSADLSDARHPAESQDLKSFDVTPNLNLNFPKNKSFDKESQVNFK